ncbi:MAG TPA: glycosyltransferase [Acidobacteriaceae bacterium]|nr:glycosyltransferase [Acidobacteriaceae bacterium]
MSRSLRIAYLAHAVRSDWNNGNAHFLRGLLRSLVALGHDVAVFEPCPAWSISNLRDEPLGAASLSQFSATYPELHITPYNAMPLYNPALWRNALKGRDVVILHEWNPPELAAALLELRPQMGFRLLFHDTHHRASSSPEQIRLFGTQRFDGILAFGDSLRRIYQERFGIRNVWTLHEAADTTVFCPQPGTPKTTDVVWIGNWGEEERSKEICDFLLRPAMEARNRRFQIFGVRYPEQGLAALSSAGVDYGGYLPNLEAPAAYARSRLTIHIPRQQYATAMHGIPTIRVFEALACGIPLISVPWDDDEQLFREGDLLFVRSGAEMKRAIEKLLTDESASCAQALRGLETILSRHTCAHRAEQLLDICEELLQ